MDIQTAPPKVILNHESVKITNESFDRLVRVCEKPQTPSSKLLNKVKVLARKGILVETKI